MSSGATPGPSSQGRRQCASLPRLEKRAAQDDWVDFEDPPPGRQDVRRAFRKGVLVGCGASLVGVAALAVAAMIVFSLLMDSGHIPDTAAVPGDEVKDSLLELLREDTGLREDERVLYYYSAGTFDFHEDGNYFTDSRVVSYWIEGGEFFFEEATYPEIDDIVPTYEEAFLENSQIWIERGDGSSFMLYVSNEDGGDETFISLLIETWQANR